ncbi:MAG TPA: MMPL family transporter [Thermoanaerobaculia bacterium]|nr:MMPL family transporter [Thermoanaerobaculia bacterium]
MIWGLALALALPGIARLTLRTDGHALVPPGAPALAVDREVRKTFGLRDQLLVLVDTNKPGGIYNPRTLHLLADLTAAIGRLPGVGRANVRSLATTIGSRYDAARHEFMPLFEPFPETSARIAELREEVAWIDLPVGLLVAKDGSAATVVVGLPPREAPGGEDRYELWRRIDERARRFADSGHRISVIGAPAAEALLGRHVLGDLRFLVPAALALVALLLYLGSRRIAMVALGLGKVGVCLAILFGAMGWVGEPVFLTTAVLPVILVAVGLADEIHLVTHYRQLLAVESSPERARERTFEEIGHAVTLALLTTAIGFGSFVLAPIPALAHFGAVAAVGVGLCLVFSLTATPAALALLSAERFRAPRAERHVLGRRAFERLADTVTARPRTVLALLGVATVAVGLGIFRLVVQDSWLEGFSPRSGLYRATTRLDETFSGSHRLLVVVAFPGKGAPARPLLDPEVLNRLGELEALLRETPEVGGVVGPYRLVTTAAGIAGGDVRFRRVRARAEWNTVLYAQLDRVLGVAARREIVTDDFSRGVVEVFLRKANYRDTVALIDRLRRFERDRLVPLGGSIALAGDIAVSQEMIPGIVHGQIGSLGGALLGSALTVAFGMRRWGAGLAAIVPALGAILWTFGVMGWIGVPLGVATSMFCAITLGIGDDYAIHFLERRELAKSQGEARPTRVALVEAGPAILWDALVIALGFGLLALSQVPANRRLGLLLGLALLTAAAFTLTGLSAVLSVHDDRTRHD